MVTLGRSARREHLLVPPEELAARGIELHEVARGGDVTYHGPGQLVGYLIVDLAARGTPDVGAFLRRIEAVLIGALAELGVEGYVRPGWTGVFAAGPLPPRQPDRLEYPASAASGGARSEAKPSEVDRRPRKIASIGIGLRGWVTWHGFALNVTTDLSYFDLIVPCGIQGVVMTSLQQELKERAPRDLWGRALDAVIAGFAETFQQTPQMMTLDEIEAVA